MDVHSASQRPENLNYLFSQAPVALAFLEGPEFIVGSANPSMLEIWGKDESIIGLPLLKALPEIQDQPFPDLLREVYSTGQEYKGIEAEVTLGILQKGYFDFIYAPIFNKKTQIIGISVVANDVTEQVCSRLRLEASEHKFRDLILEADVATALYIGPEMRIEIANEAMINVWGRGNSVIGKTIREAIPELEGQPFHDLLDEVYKTGITYKATEDRVDFLINGRMQTFYYNFSYKALRDANGEIYGILNMAVNVTEQVLAKKKLLLSEAKLASLIQHAPVAIALFNRSHLRIETANEESLKLWRRSKDIIGKTAAEVFSDRERKDFIPILQRVFETGEPFIGNELPIYFHDDPTSPAYITFVYQPVFEEGQVRSVISAGYDVTELVLSRKRAEASEGSFRNLVREAPVATAVLRGEEMIIELANKAILEIWGKDESVIGKKILDALPELIGQEYPELLSEVYHTGKEFSDRESRAVLWVNGKPKEYYLNFTYTPLIAEEGENGILIMSVDVTEQVRSRKLLEENQAALKLSEARLSEMADSMPQQVWTAQPDGTIDYVNKLACEYFGAPEDQLLVTWQSYVHPDDVEPTAARWMASVQNKTNLEAEFRLRKKDGGYDYFLARASPIVDESGNVLRWIGTNTDINEFKLLQRQKDDFIGIASHELKTPVTSIKAYTQVLEAMLRKEGDDYKADLLKKMDLQLNKFTSLIEDLLDVTKIQTGKMQFNDDYFDFNELVSELVEEVQRTTSIHKIVEDTVRVGMIFADRDRVGQVISNLLTNAIKYSPKAEKIVVRVRMENGEVRLCVQDFGIGIPSDKKEQVFQQFYRVSGTKEHTFPGIGLGLYICSQIVEREGGEIWVNSELGKGSTFCFSLPIEPRERR